LTESDDSGIRARGEEALSELAQAIAENPLVGGALARALSAGERASVAQRQAIGALNLASSSDFERLELRLRSFASRLEAIEDAIDDVRDDLAALKARDARGPAQEPDG
jgi:chromosome segregation ATPase